jgi:hypothetical protein
MCIRIYTHIYTNLPRKDMLVNIYTYKDIDIHIYTHIFINLQYKDMPVYRYTYRDINICI